MASVAKYRPFSATNFFSNSLLDNFFNRSIADFVGSDVVMSEPVVNVLETNNSFELELAAPGFEKQDFALDVKDDFLIISAKRKEDQDNSEERVTRREFRFEAFERSFKLPNTVNQEAISAVYNNGILQVALPKKDEAKAIVKTISVR